MDVSSMGLAGDTMNEDLMKREQLSALADGQLQGEALSAALRFAAEDAGREAWQEYHLIGDVLRSAELAKAQGSEAFVARLHQCLDQDAGAHGLRALSPEAVSIEPVSSIVRLPADAANGAVFRWKMVAGLASLAAVTAIGWSVLEGSGSEAAGRQLAAAPAAPSAPVAQLAASSAADSQVMIRDPRLDELLAAHRQFSGTTALQMPAQFLRNANFENTNR